MHRIVAPCDKFLRQQWREILVEQQPHAGRSSGSSRSWTARAA